MASHFGNLLFLQGGCGIFEVKPAFSRDVFSKKSQDEEPIYGACDLWSTGCLLYVTRLTEARMRGEGELITMGE